MICQAYDIAVKLENVRIGLRIEISWHPQRCDEVAISESVLVDIDRDLGQRVGVHRAAVANPFL